MAPMLRFTCTVRGVPSGSSTWGYRRYGLPGESDASARVPWVAVASRGIR